MFLWIFSFTLLLNLSFAEVGRVIKVLGSADGHVLRNSERIILTEELSLEEGDSIFTANSVVSMHIYPASQISLTKNTEVKISKALIEESQTLEKAFSVLDFVKGLIRVQVTKDQGQEIEQKIAADGVEFGVRGTEFEVTNEGEEIDLDVVEGEVTVSSPFVHTFVPEIVKANEGFRFNKRKRQFHRRKFRQRFKNHPGFMDRAKLKKSFKRKIRKELRQKRKRKKS